MKHKLFTLISFTILSTSLIFTACKEEEDKNAEKNLSDPRIRSMVISPTSRIVVNDLDAIIFNYDSLDKGTNLSYIHTYLYGYISQPTFKVKKDGEWIEFKNGSGLDLSDKVEILSISEDNSQQKAYTIDIRVHNYDVAAFTWQEIATLDVSGKISTQKSFTHNKTNLWFYSDSKGGSGLYSSSDLKKWEKKSLEINNADWSSSAILGDSIFVQTENGEVYSSHIDKLQFSAYPSSAKNEKILFTIGSKMWSIGNDGNERYLYSKNEGDFQKGAALSPNFPSENITSFTTLSGYTSLGYIYASQNGQGTIWSVDSKGNMTLLQKADGTIPSLKQPNVFAYLETIGIVGGEKEDGTFSTQCFSSKNGGVTWQHDWHKDLSEGISNSGTFAYSEQGEIVFVGGNTSTGFSKIIRKGVLNKLTADDLNYQN